MADRDDERLSELVAELVTALRDLEGELESPRERGFRPPTPRELRRFTSEVAVPGAILVLETNIRALRLLQRALRLSESVEEGTETAGDRARSVGETTLDRLDDALAELETTLRGRPDADEAARLVEDARRLREQVQSRLDEYATDAGGGSGETSSHEQMDETGDCEESSDGAPQVDVDAELESIKAELDEDDEPRPDDADGDGDGDSTGDVDDTPSTTDGENPDGPGE